MRSWPAAMQTQHKRRSFGEHVARQPCRTGAALYFVEPVTWRLIALQTELIVCAECFLQRAALGYSANMRRMAQGG